jgi:hypothetical protein
VPLVTVFVGARPFLLTEQEALRLAGLLRTAFTDEKPRRLLAGLRLARALELVAVEGLDEPLEIGWPQAEAVIHSLPEVTAHAYEGLDGLLHAARRLAVDATSEARAARRLAVDATS